MGGRGVKFKLKAFPSFLNGFFNFNDGIIMDLEATNLSTNAQLFKTSVEST